MVKIMTTENAWRGKLGPFFLVVAVLTGCQPRPAEVQEAQNIEVVNAETWTNGDWPLTIDGGLLTCIELERVFGHRTRAVFIKDQDGEMWPINGTAKDLAARFGAKPELEPIWRDGIGIGLLIERGLSLCGWAQDYSQVFTQVRKAAEQGDAKAQSSLGFMYDKGEGIPEDDQEAVRWYRKAAEQGDAKGQFGLGGMYDKGEGVPQDYREALKWYRKAADQGHADAQSYLVVFQRLLDLGYLKTHQEVEGVSKESTVPEPTDGVTKMSAFSRDATRPTVLSRIEPVYSEAARKANLQGKVLLSAIVRKDGSLEVLNVVRGLGLGLDENAIKALKKWRFRPGMRDGKPVDVALNIEVSFSLRSRF